MIHPWLEPLWARLVALGERLPHAILITGAPGLGKRDLAEALAARLLCERPEPGGCACGHCTPCQWRLAGTHPDLRRLVPESEETRNAADKAPGEASDLEAGGGESKAKSTQIVIGQVRAVQEALTMTSHRGGRRALIVDPAEAMNPFTANALLKLLEEPPDACIFMLVSSAPRKLLPTLRSRCQQWHVPRPDTDALRRWQAVQSEAGQISAALLAVCGGMPLAARRLAAQGVEALLERFTNDLAEGEIDPLRLAGQWETWLKKDKTALAAGIGLPMLADWMQRWVSDLSALRLGGRVRYFPTCAERLARLSERMSVAAASNCYNEFVNVRRVANHPLNPRLFLEDMLLRYARTLEGVRS
ncbi:MAG: DNA polymerase III subunit delta' [Azoarcus sp.]|jgi:DNA polymerase-3 subunit delta'|nr:DNA polymerase III subunit delta' [Azoarcus sp.]